MITYYTNAKIITMNPQIPYVENGFIKVDGSRIARIGTMREYKPDLSEPGAANEDLHGKIIMPGMVCSHSHFYGQLIRGMAIRREIRNWQQMLSRLWWKVDRLLDQEMNYASAMMGLIEGVKCGVTTFVDHHASTPSAAGSLDRIEQAVKKVGARAILSYEVTDRNGPDHCREGLAENVRFLKKCQNRDEHDTVRAMFGLHALYSLSETTLRTAVEMEKPFDCGFHLHCAEGIGDVTASYERYDMHPLEFLHQLGIVKPNSILAHFVQTGSREWDIAAQTKVTIAHNVQSNLSNAVGICPVEEMLDRGVHVALGGDGFYYELFQELNMAILLQHLQQQNPGAMNADKVLQLGFSHPFRIVENAFNLPFGMLREGNQADCIMLDYNPPTPLHGENYLSHLTSAFMGHVTDAIVAGRRLLKNRTVLGVEEEAELENCRNQAARLEAEFSRM